MAAAFRARAARATRTGDSSPAPNSGKRRDDEIAPRLPRHLEPVQQPRRRRCAAAPLETRHDDRVELQALGLVNRQQFDARLRAAAATVRRARCNAFGQPRQVRRRAGRLGLDVGERVEVGLRLVEFALARRVSPARRAHARRVRRCRATRSGAAPSKRFRQHGQQCVAGAIARGTGCEAFRRAGSAAARHRRSDDRRRAARAGPRASARTTERAARRAMPRGPPGAPARASARAGRARQDARRADRCPSR